MDTREERRSIEKKRMCEVNVADSQPGEEDFLPTGVTVGTGPWFSILFDLTDLVEGLVIPSLIPCLCIHFRVFSS